MQQSNIGTIKIIKTSKALDDKQQYKERGKRHNWERLEPSKRHVQETKQ